MSDLGYHYQIRSIAAPYAADGEVIAEFDNPREADAYWQQHIAVGSSAAVLDHVMTVRRGETVWSMDEAPREALGWNLFEPPSEES